MSLKKLSISQEQADKVRELLDRGLSPYKIAIILKISRPKIWRNMEVMGIECRKRKPRQLPKTQYFRWSDFGNNSVI